MYGRGIHEFLPTMSLPALRKRFAGLSEGRSDRFTERVIGRDRAGRTFSAELTGISVKGTAGKPVGIVVLLRPDDDTGGTVTVDAEPAVSVRRTLSKLDAQVLEGVASGASTVQLATRLYMSRQGVEYRVGLLLRKFQAPNRPALVARAHGAGLLTVGQWPPRVPPELIA
ncbi:MULTISPECIES: LuxR C-terminal-related transcriptional regulator [Streptomyces]|nr:LuxR C-terminal-related transcriptional regulator [Streptomyces ruber]